MKRPRYLAAGAAVNAHVRERVKRPDSQVHRLNWSLKQPRGSSGNDGRRRVRWTVQGPIAGDACRVPDLALQAGLGIEVRHFIVDVCGGYPRKGLVPC
jgi:hypothetical protein